MMTIKNYFPVLTGSWRASGAIIPTFFLMTALTLALVCSLAAPSPAMSGDPSSCRPGLRNSPEADKLSKKQLDLLVKSLREKTGFLDMRFDEDGFLTLGDRTCIAGGSVAARALLAATVGGMKAILLSNRRRSSEVAFARLTAETHVHVPTGAQIEAYLLEMDFADFDHLQGGQEAVAAFDPGFVALHELAHAVLALEDDKTGVEALGDCEMYVNRVRQELGLPERQYYFARARKTTRGVRVSEILFIQREQDKTRRFSLRWETNQVERIVERAPLQ
jgi:hypothetical protein